ncbi:chorismate lyase [Pseudomonas syringae pv. tagetis]|uniref:Probable chorismate pyruvate-lyase n=2 Tax=Pseudomonas syringae group genomosp. 7 TaxID=251699 RepID=A0A0N8T2M3_9PSED|nr:chorismate lyase [Pseudomonas syringae group genomosp. 7]KPY83192.1 putative chorismate pyruvate-lyase [Pseudomonas syringae pv. tagetis]RMV52572.1 putative chorismate pyruvate-lyase [Pseudomonas syringae pv. helianthi]RMW12939.1 putative chorismate pyruvate-lyase [Pseudomonas syringae pv. tagetis]RMW14514.1 putative chorismate pyruvate-lyase [Pseudomonas syringae pv. tagetis]UNB68522.1 chorismate lyase [Pseudomonas syringae pv. tagetis]
MTQQSPAFISPIWLRREQLIDAPEPLLLEWLFNQDSLTRRLNRLSDGGFSVLPQFEGWQALRRDECLALDLPATSEGWVREAYLRGNDIHWVFARSVAARSALQEGGLNMDDLGTRSLGELLFSDPAFVRGPLEVCHYPEAWLPAADAARGLWARRSRFSRGALSVLVAEVFLPALCNAIHDKDHA